MRLKELDFSKRLRISRDRPISTRKEMILRLKNGARLRRIN